MPDTALAQLTPAILRQAQDAAAPVLTAGQNTRPQFTLVYLAVPGCGDMHNYNNLRAADALPNVQLAHVNLFHPNQPFAGAPGQLWRFPNVGAVISRFTGLGMEPAEANHVLLLDSQGKPVREFPTSQDRNGFQFLNEVKKLTGNAQPQPQRGAVRG